MKVYAETSAVLRWVFAAPGGKEIGRILAKADAVVASRLTLAEGRRVLARALALGEVEAGQVPEMSGVLHRAAAHWTLAEITSELLDRLSQRFPIEPVRTIDAIHLVTAMTLSSEVPDLHLLSTDDRIRRNAALLGILVLP